MKRYRLMRVMDEKDKDVNKHLNFAIPYSSRKLFA